MLQGVYGGFPHHNNGSHLNKGIADSAPWQSRWHRLATQSESWYARPSGALGRRFNDILAAEWRGFLGRSWNSERPLVFSHVVLTKTLGVRRDREIWDRIMQCMDLWERGLYTVLVGDADAEGASQECSSASGGEE